MKKLKLRFDRNTWVHLEQNFVHLVKSVPKFLFIDYSHVIDLVVVLIVLVIAATAMVQLLYLDPPDIAVVEQDAKLLKTDIIDRLELWIEDRDHEKSRVMNLPEARLFEVEKQ